MSGWGGWGEPAGPSFDFTTTGGGGSFTEPASASASSSSGWGSGGGAASGGSWQSATAASAGWGTAASTSTGWGASSGGWGSTSGGGSGWGSWGSSGGGGGSSTGWGSSGTSASASTSSWGSSNSWGNSATTSSWGSSSGSTSQSGGWGGSSTAPAGWGDSSSKWSTSERKNTETLMTNDDLVLARDLPDTVSSVQMAADTHAIIAGSWDCTVRLWSDAEGVFSPKSKLTHNAPVLCTAFGEDGKTAFSGSADGCALMWNLSANEATPVAQHTAAIKDIAWMPQHKVLVTGSWDGTMSFWDVRTSPKKPQATSNAGGRVVCFTTPLPTVSTPQVILANSNRGVALFDLRSHAAPTVQFNHPLKYQLRSIASFVDFSGFVVGSVEGRAAIHYVQDSQRSRDFAYKCHRLNNDDVYAVNSIAFHPVHNTFSTAGSDGTINWWDKESKQRLKPWPKMDLPVTASAFSLNGRYFVYALGYDWHAGASGAGKASSSGRVQPGPLIALHRVDDALIRPKNSRR